MSRFRKISIELDDAQADALLAFVGSFGRSDIRDLIDQGVEIELQPATEAIVALSQALKKRTR